MTAMLHYALIKGLRDRSLPVFVLIGPMGITMAVIGVSLAAGHRDYPLYTLSDFADGLFAGVVAVTIAGMSGFWMFRSEVATKAIGSFVIASRPIKAFAALVLFAAMTGMLSWAGTTAMHALLTLRRPELAAAFGMMAIETLAAASAGAMLVMISSQPTMLVWACIASAVFVPWYVNPTSRPQIVMIAPLVVIVCSITGTLLLERRCAA